MSAASRKIIGIMGASNCTEVEASLAEETGRLLAENGYHLLCGGGTGIMTAAARGAASAGGITIGIMPGRNASESPPNPYIEIPIFTGLHHARNAINILSADGVIAIGGAWGTLSEIALAAADGKPVILLNSWSLDVPPGVDHSCLHPVATPAAAMALLTDLIPR